MLFFLFWWFNKTHVTLHFFLLFSLLSHSFSFRTKTRSFSLCTNVLLLLSLFQSLSSFSLTQPLFSAPSQSFSHRLERSANRASHHHHLTRSVCLVSPTSVHGTLLQLSTTTTTVGTVVRRQCRRAECASSHHLFFSFVNFSHLSSD